MPTESKLSADRVDKIIRDCLFRQEEVPNGVIPSNAVIIDGVIQKFGLHKERLESHRDEVRELLLELPDQFMKEKGGGWTFLNMCNDKHGHQWGEHCNVEALIVLGIGLGYVSYPLPREMWSMLPGSVPYVCVNVGG